MGNHRGYCPSGGGMPNSGMMGVFGDAREEPLIVEEHVYNVVVVELERTCWNGGR
jgi:hypothetical protein